MSTEAGRRVAVVTGGAGAIGGAIAAELAAAGHTVVILDQAGDPPVDLAREDQVRAAAAEVLRQHGRCDVLVHAAACFDRAGLATVELAGWRRVQAVNVEAALLLAQAFIPGMAARGFGRVIFVTSNTVWAPPSGDMLAYVTSKGALVAMARTLAGAFGADGVAVTCVAPRADRYPGYARGRARRPFRRRAVPPGAAPHAGTRRCGGHGGVSRLGRRGRPDRPDRVRGRRPGPALAAQDVPSGEDRGPAAGPAGDRLLALPPRRGC